ncbi:EAL domain-containing protein [Rhodophyticola sp. CCM32]|uniref:EAL domain-containing protein n=1 Tax=Rhodophyticola sp. CCM32 TaxID=2916397 RepID=UPI00107F8DC7|nr:EAL domain-containing protein [Rhodophyticola sp. CCM32]QBY02180.1 EAL domain-containing protein [Rhodophyticola sp. CCM32]
MPRQQQKFHDTEAASSPLDMAIVERDRGTIAMVRHALAAGNVALAYQPVISCGRGNPVAYYEGLMRLFDDTGRVIPAADFMGAVEDHELGRQIDCAALSIGLNALKAHPSLRLAINMSARSIGVPAWMNMIRKCTHLHPEISERLILEITETSAMQVPEIVAIFMEEMQDKGITFALDDFGAGQTSFRHLKDFCFDILKIDGQFARNVHDDPDNQVLTEALLSIARHFDMLAVAEAVETAQDAQWLTHAGLDCLQGYYFAAPSLTPPWKAAGERSMQSG